MLAAAVGFFTAQTGTSHFCIDCAWELFSDSRQMNVEP